LILREPNIQKAAKKAPFDDGGMYVNEGIYDDEANVQACSEGGWVAVRFYVFGVIENVRCCKRGVGKDVKEGNDLEVFLAKRRGKMVLEHLEPSDCCR
jgi:hypothetical protein